MTTEASKPVFIIDANFLINFDKWMPQANFPSFWRELERTLREGKWILLDVVVREVSREQSLKQWCERQRIAGFVVPITVDDKLSGAEINRRYPMVDNTTGKSETDTYIIAHALAHSYTIFSDETPKKASDPLYKIPDVCGFLNVGRRKKASAFFAEIGLGVF